MNMKHSKYHTHKKFFQIMHGIRLIMLGTYFLNKFSLIFMHDHKYDVPIIQNKN